MIKCKVEDEHNDKFPMAITIELYAAPFVGCEIVVGEQVYEVRKVQIDCAHMWLTVRYIGE